MRGERSHLTNGDVESLDNELDRFTPNLEESAEVEAVYACSIMEFALKSCQAGISAEAAAGAAWEAIKYKAGMANLRGNDAHFWEHPAVTAELLGQDRLITHLQRIEKVTEDDAIALKEIYQETSPVA